MTGKAAYRILGISPGTGKSEIKKRYRQLMMQVHPDVDAASREIYTYSVQEINAAYAVLMKEKLTGGENVSHNGKGRAAKGKYVWKTEEDFPLFLLSIYQCSKCILDERLTASFAEVRRR